MSSLRLSHYHSAQKRVNDALKHADQTQAVFLGENLISQVGSLFRSRFDQPTTMIVADKNTFAVAGRQLDAELRGEGILNVETPFIFEEDDFHTDKAHLEKINTFLKNTDAIPIAVGSGTINDLVKRAAFERNRPYMVFATAASMDGYTAFGASTDYDGFKQTLECPAPRVVLADLDILCDAPADMCAAGYADLLAKVPAGADWILADFIGTEPINDIAWHLVHDSLRDWLADPVGIAQRDKNAILSLIEGLIMSGLAMQKAKSSRTASGAEHMFSHLWDNQNHKFQGKTPFHGFKVGIGSIASSQLHQKMLTLEATDFLEAGKRVASFYRPWEEVEKLVEKHFGTDNLLGKQILEQSRQKHVSLAETEKRIQKYADHWSQLREKLHEQLLPAEDIRDRLRQCGAPSTSEEIGIDRKRMDLSFEQTQLIRCRYNILDFTLESGQWDRMVPP